MRIVNVILHAIILWKNVVSNIFNSIKLQYLHIQYNYNLYRIIKVIFYSKLSHLRVYTSSFYTICKEPLYAPAVRLAPKCCHGYQWQLFTFNLKEDSSIFINSKKMYINTHNLFTTDKHIINLFYLSNIILNICLLNCTEIKKSQRVNPYFLHNCFYGYI